MKGKERDMFKYAEKCLYDYPRNMACLEVLRVDLQLEHSGSDVHAQNYQAQFICKGLSTNPIEARQMRIERLDERIRQLERCTQPISRLIDDLKAPYVHEGSVKAELLPVIELHYFGENSLTYIMRELHIGRQSLHNRRRMLVKMLMRYMGCE